MTFQLTVSPDFPPNRIAGWYIFNTWLQKALDLPIHLELYPSFEAQREAIGQGKVDLIYANPYDAAMLIREKGFTALARPQGKMDEAVVVAAADAPYDTVDDLEPGLRLAVTNDPAVNLLGMMMLEPAELDASNLEVRQVESYPVAVKLLLQGEADMAFLLKEALEKLTATTRRQLKVLVDSQIGDLYHAFLVGPRLADKHEAVRSALVNMHTEAKGKDVLENLGFPAWEAVSADEAEFMMNLVEALK
ncbi:MAG TPA: phosphate/phosphite/phosphonate ABC transporter substrate-binding protein [Chloroflexi bacterium]|nr:phosphate/phosphite/phosphonate ABC transporter substrate-binding protein [Chloroflexota bacterium]